MNKKRFSIICFLLVIVFICTACDGSVTRDIRHAGFTVGNKFKCSDFYPKDKNDTSYKKVKYFTGTRIIDSKGKIYELSLGQVYANNENCKVADTPIQVVAIFDNKIVKSIDNKYYYLDSQNSVASYMEVPKTDNSYSIYDMMLKGGDVVKALTADSSKGIYYVLKTDGNVYSMTLSKENVNSKPKLMGTSIVYDSSDYDSPIIDFNYAGNNLSTFVRTEDSLYRMKITNLKQCSKYADVSCKYAMKEDTTFKKYKDRIIVFNGTTLITDYKLMFSISK